MKQVEPRLDSKLEERKSRSITVGFAVLLIGLTIGVIVGANFGRTPTSITTVSTNSPEPDPVPTGGPCGVPERCVIPTSVSFVHGRANMGSHGTAQLITFSNEKTGSLSSGVNYNPDSQQYQQYFLYLPIGHQYQVIIFENTGSSQTRPSCNAVPFNFKPSDVSDQVQDFVCD